MKKILLGICSLAFVSCLSAGIAWNNNSVEVAKAETSVFTETKCQISNDGDKMLVVTGITDVSAIYEVGYYVDGEKYVAGEGETAETNKYYQSLTLGSVTKTAAEFYNNDDVDGLLVWEIAYDSAKEYSIQPYALIGTWEGNALIAPEEEVPTVGAEKENFNVLTVTFVDEEGAELGTANVNYGATVSEINAPEKDGFTFKGWYANGEEYDFDTKVTSNLTLTAKYNAHVKYSVQVLAAKYAQEDKLPWYTPGTLSYDDKTSDYASVFGLDENGQAKGEVGSTVDLTSKIASLKGAKLNATASTVSGTIEEDGSLELTVCLDFDEEVLGFGMDDIKIGEWSCGGLSFTLEYMNGQCGLLVDGTIGNGKELHINVDDLDVTKYASILLNWSEQSATKNTEIAFVDNTDTLSSYSKVSTYSGALNLLTQFPSVTNIKTIRMKFMGGGQKTFFISGIEKRTYMKETVTYSVDNGNIMNIAKVLGNNGTLSTGSKYFDGTGLMADYNALIYNYSSEVSVNGEHTVGFTLDFGGVIKLDDYESIKITLTKNITATFVDGRGEINEPGLTVYADGTSIYTHYNQKYGIIIDVKDIKTISSFSQLEFSVGGGANITECNIYIASIELVAKTAQS